MDTPAKTCRNCGNEFPNTTEFFYTEPGSGTKNFCKPCYSLKQGYTPKERVPNGMRRCVGCKQIFAATKEFFYASKYTKSGLTSRCKQCSNQVARETNAKNPANRRRIGREYARRQRDRFPEKTQERNHLWWVNNRSKSRAYAHKRRAKARSLPVTLTDQEWQSALKFFNNQCAVCDRPPGLWHKLAQDHWVPVSKGGAYIPDNIIPLCHGRDGCNNSKCNRDPLEWLTDRYGKRKANQILKRIYAYFEWVKSQKE